MLVGQNYLKSFQFKVRNFQNLNYITSILNVNNYYQLPLLKILTLTFKLVSKDRFIVLAYYTLFKYFFNMVPRIVLVRKAHANIVQPLELRLVLTRRNMVHFLTSFFFAYQEENIEDKRTYVVSPLYKGNSCTIILKNFFFLGLIMDLLLLYKNEGLFLGNYEKLYCKFQFLSKVNLWNYFFLNFLFAHSIEDDSGSSSDDE